MDKFEIGDKARVVYVRNSPISAEWKAGAVVTIYALEDLRPNEGEGGDCTIVMQNGLKAYPRFNQLEPIVSDEEPATWKEIQDEFGWNPTKEVAL